MDFFPWVFCGGKPRTGPRHPNVDLTTAYWREWSISLKQLVRLSLMESQVLLVFAQKGQWLADQAVFHVVDFWYDQRHGFIPPKVLDLTFPFGALPEWLVISFLQPVEVPLSGSRSICYISHSSVLCAEFLRGLSLPLLGSLINMLNSVSPSVSPCGWPLVIGLQMGFKLLMAALWAQHLSSFQCMGLSSFLVWTASVCLSEEMLRSACEVKAR